MALTSKQLIALQNLADKSAGEHVAWIQIADARALTDLGFAERTSSGWIITEAGKASLAAHKL